MADNTVMGSTDTIATDDLTTLNGGAVSGVKVAREKIGFGSDGTLRDVDASNPLPTYVPAPTTGTITSPALSVSSFTILAANTARLGATVYNDSANVLYLALSATTSTTSYTVQLPAGAYYEVPSFDGRPYSGIITGISAVATGNCRVTELT